MNVYDYTARRRMRKVLSALVCSAALASGAATLDAAPAHAAANAPALSEISCSEAPARFFQLRDGDATAGYSEVWSASILNPESASPTYYDWKLVHTFTGVKPVAIAAREIKRSTNTTNPGWVSYVYFSGTDKDLHQFRWAPNEGSPWQEAALTTTGAFGYKALAWDGRLWGVKGDSNGQGDLYALTGLDQTVADPWDQPSGASLVKNGFGYPKSFYGTTSSNYQLGFAELTGELRYADSGGTYSESTVRSSGWNAGRTVDLGGGLLYRFLGGSTNEIRRYTIGDISGGSTALGAGQTVKTGVVSTDTPTTTASSLCSAKTTMPTSTAEEQQRAEMISRAKHWYDVGVPYNQSAWFEGYRTDCSGLVSMAWKLMKNGSTYSTWTGEITPTWSYRLGSWGGLKPGDALLTDGHVILFEKWVDSDHDRYWYYAESNSNDDMDHATAYVGGGYSPLRKNGL